MGIRVDRLGLIKRQSLVIQELRLTKLRFELLERAERKNKSHDYFASATLNLSFFNFSLLKETLLRLDCYSSSQMKDVVGLN